MILSAISKYFWKNLTPKLKGGLESKISNYDILINGARKIKNGVRSMFISSEKE